MLQIENAFFDLAKCTDRNCLIICDRGAMDASAFISREQWETILARNGLDEVEIRDNRYNQVSFNVFFKFTQTRQNTCFLRVDSNIDSVASNNTYLNIVEILFLLTKKFSLKNIKLKILLIKRLLSLKFGKR